MELNDKLNYFKIGLRTGIIKIEQFSNWLDNAFLNSDDDIYLELQECKNINEIISCINEHHYNTGYDNNPDIAVKDLLKIVKNKYINKEWDFKQTAERLYKIFLCIERDSNYFHIDINGIYTFDEPYLTMSYVEDGIGFWADDEDVMQRIEFILQYFD